MKPSRFSIYVFIALFLVSLFFVAQLFYVFMTPIVLALVLVSIFNPVFSRCLKITYGNRFLASLLTTLLILSCVVLPLSFLVVTLMQQALQLYQKSVDGNVLDTLVELLSSPSPWIVHIKELASRFHLDLSSTKLAQLISEFASSLGLFVYQSARSVASNAVVVAFDFLIMVVIVFSLFVGGKNLKNYLVEISPLPLTEAEQLVNQFRETSRAVFLGNGLVCILEGLCGGFGIYLFNLGPGLFWGVVIAFAALIPAVGATIIVLPASIWLFAHDQLLLGWLFLAYNASYLVVLEGIVKPRFISKKSRVHPVLVLLSILAGVQIFGVLGLFYGPLAITMFVSLVEIYKEHYR